MARFVVKLFGFFFFFCFLFSVSLYSMNEQKHRRFRVIKASGSALELCNLFHHHGSIVTLIGYEQPNSVLIKAAFLHSINLYFFAICLLKSSSRVYILSIFDALRYVKKTFFLIINQINRSGYIKQTSSDISSKWRINVTSKPMPLILQTRLFSNSSFAPHNCLSYPEQQVQIIYRNVKYNTL